ncbi:hypothetical protein [Pumilibacter intestinalis]|uniref:hypothetical protein n=1 Tax=Pumilibacter intestinalis TaxID=2941511 RepID=UPI00204241D8|nr:hypothetical protein [Pumilibacter intestinalis]
MKKSFVAILLILCCAFAGCTAGGKTNGKTEREKIPTTTDVLTIDQNKYMFGLSELSSEMNGGVDVEVDNDFIIGNVKALGVKSMRVWMHLHNIIRRAPDSDEISILQGTANIYHEYFARLKEAGVERILVMNHAFIYPVGCHNSDVQCVPHPTDDREMYVRFLKLYGDCYELLATEFPEITYWEPGNEFDMVDGTFLHPIGWVKGSSNVFTESEAARITADLCWYANRGLQKVDKKNVTVFPGMTMSPSTALYLEETYRWIESKKIPTGEEYSDTNSWNYFQICAWHPYPDYRGVAAAADTCEDLHDVMVEHGDGDKKVWITETGFSEDRFSYDQERIDRLYKDLLDITKSRLKFVETLFLFRMTDCYTTPISDYEDHFGLFYAPGDSVNKGKPKPYTETIYKWFYGENADTSGLYWYSAAQEE